MGKSALSSSSPRAEEQGRGGTPAAALGRWPGLEGGRNYGEKGKWGPGGSIPLSNFGEGVLQEWARRPWSRRTTAAMGGTSRGEQAWGKGREVRKKPSAPLPWAGATRRSGATGAAAACCSVCGSGASG